MRKIQNLDDLIIKYYDSIKEFSDYIASNYSPLNVLNVKQFGLIMKNDKEAGKLYWKHEQVLSDFERVRDTSVVYTCSEHLIGMLEQIINEPSQKRALSDGSIKYLLEYINDSWDLFEGVFDEDDSEVTHEALKYLLKMPNFEPDKWLARNFSIGGVFLSHQVKVPIDVMRRYQEAYTCYIYGLFMSTCAMCRSTLEFMLKEKYPALEQQDLFTIIDKWDSISEIRNYKDVRMKAESIRIAANESLHKRKGDKKVLVLLNQVRAQKTLSDLKYIFEFFYRQKWKSK